MFWIGLLVGVIIATIAIAGWLVYGCWKVYGTWDAFESTCNIVTAATENRESEVLVYHNGEVIACEIYEEL